MILWIILAVLVIGLDQLTKWLVITHISATETITVLPGLFDFVNVQNTGAAFSILSGNTLILSVISIVFCIAVIVYMVKKKPKNKLLLTALGLIFGGAVGNVIDRIFRGYVVDFIETVFIEFPVFNVADIAITCGAVLLVIYLIFFEGKEETAQVSQQPAEEIIIAPNEQAETIEQTAEQTEEGESDGEADSNSTAQ